MKRVVVAMAALAAALAFSPAASAITRVFDVSGTGSLNTVSQFAPNPPGFFQIPFSAPSSVTLDITGSAVTLTTSTLIISGATPFGSFGSISRTVVVTASGATGVLVGDDIHWDTPAEIETIGVFYCSGFICTIIGLDPSDPIPISLLADLTGTTPVTSSALGIWDLDASLTQILGSKRQVSALGGPTPPPGLDLPAEWFLYGSGDLGFNPTLPVPEPSIGVQFTGGGSVALVPTVLAGVVPQRNYNVASGVSGSGLVLEDHAGAVTAATLGFTTNESGYVNNLFAAPTTSDEILNHGILNGTAGTNPTITITGIPYPRYDLIVYTLDTEVRSQRVTATTSAGSTSFTVRSPSGDAPGYQDADPTTQYIYTQGTTNSSTPVIDSDYVRFSNLTGNVTISADARISTFPSNTNNNAYINGLQILPEPGVALSLLVAVPVVAGLAARRRRAAPTRRCQTPEI